MRIAITGSSGLIGTALRTSLEADGHVVIPVGRGAAGPGAITWDPASGTLDAEGLEGLDGVVHLAGASIGEKRWTDEQKARIVDSRIQGTTLLATTLARLERKPTVLVSGSAIGFYGDRGDEVLTESSGAGAGFLADLCVDWEAAALPAEQAGIRVARLRTGIVLDRAGGALPRMSLPIRFGVGGRLGSGKQWMSWISLTDHVAAVRFLLDHDVAGPVNATAPGPATNAEFTKALGRVLHRPTALPIPKFAPKLLLGGQLADELLFASQRVHPGVLTDAGFVFQDPVLEPALHAVLGK